jgi:hypothetical protein
MEDGLRYSDRKLLAESGALGELDYEVVPPGLRTAISSLIESAPSPAGNAFRKELEHCFMQHFGIGDTWAGMVRTREGDDFVDLLEILDEAGTRSYYVPRAGETRTKPRTAYPSAIEPQINRILQRHRFGYQLVGGHAHKIGSPALEVVVTGPTLLAVQRPGWEEVDRSYREALAHQRAGEIDDALTAANASVEAALKAVGMKGSTLGDLAKSLRSSSIVRSYVAGVPELLVDLLNRLQAVRSTEGDAHGKPPGATEPTPALANLAIYWAGAFLLYLAETAPPADTSEDTSPA